MSRGDGYLWLQEKLLSEEPNKKPTPKSTILMYTISMLNSYYILLYCIETQNKNIGGLNVYSRKGFRIY